MDLRDPKTAKAIVGALVAVVVIYFNFGSTMVPFSYRSRAEQGKEMKQRYDALVLQNRRARAAAERLPRLQSEAARLERRWEEAQRLLPTETEMDALLREISFRGQSSGIEFSLFRPETPVAYEHHTEHPIEVRVEGRYHQIASLLREIASMRRIVSVRDLELEQIPPNEESKHSARAHFTAVAYTLGGVPGGGAPPSAASGGAPGEPAARGRTTAPPAGRPSHGRSQE